MDPTALLTAAIDREQRAQALDAAALRLSRAASEADGALDGSLARLDGWIWTGRTAVRVTAELRDAGAELAGAVGLLRRAIDDARARARQLRSEAGSLRWRARQLQ